WAQGMAERQAQHMGQLIDEMLDVARIDRDKVVLCKKRLDLVPVIADAVERVRPLIDERCHDLDVMLPPQPLYLDADRLRLEQVIVNLLTNASKYTEAGGHIWLRVDRACGEVVLRIR